MGDKKGDVVSLFLRGLPELLMSYLGTARAGLVVNVVNAMLKDIEVENILKDCTTKVVIVDKGRESIVDKVKANIKSMKHKILLGG